MTGEVRYELHGPVAVLTIDRPERRNALSIATCRRLRELWERVEGDPAVSVAVVTGAGDRAFCAGYDVAEKVAGDAVELADFAPRVETGCLVTKPVVAAVNGAAVAAGLALVESCDLVVAAESAWFGTPEVRIGISTAPFVQSLSTMPLRVLMEMLLTGEPLSAARAYEVGFVNRLVPGERLLPEAIALAESIAAGAPLAVRAGKAMVYGGLEAMGMRAAHESARRLFAPVRASEDAAEGLRALAERRPPRWRGR